MSTKSASIPSRLLWRYPSNPALCQIFGECLTRLGDKPRGIISRKKVMVYLALTAWKLLLVTGGCLDMLFLWCISTMTLHKKKFTFKKCKQKQKKIKSLVHRSAKKNRPSKRVLLIALIDEETFQLFRLCLQVVKGVTAVVVCRSILCTEINPFAVRLWFGGIVKDLPIESVECGRSDWCRIGSKSLYALRFFLKNVDSIQTSGNCAHLWDLVFKWKFIAGNGSRIGWA